MMDYIPNIYITLHSVYRSLSSRGIPNTQSLGGYNAQSLGEYNTKSMGGNALRVNALIPIDLRCPFTDTNSYQQKIT